MNRQTKALIRSELKELFVQRRIFHFVPLLFLGIFLMAWIYPVGSPFAPIIIVVVLGLEPQFNNLLFRTPNELHALGLFPVSWKDILFAKNVAAIIHLFLFLLLASTVLLYFSPEPITPDRGREALFYVITIVFPLLHFGNEQSIRRPRKSSGLQLDDLVQSLWMCVHLVLISVPYYLFTHLAGSGMYCLLYSLATCWYWYRYSLTKTAATLTQKFSGLCLTP